MPDKRMSFNLPETTHQQLEELGKRYGTMTAAVVVAIRDLYEPGPFLEGINEFMSGVLQERNQLRTECEAQRAALARVAGELSALDQWWDADVARQSVAELRGIVDAVLGKRPAGREEEA